MSPRSFYIAPKKVRLYQLLYNAISLRQRLNDRFSKMEDTARSPAPGVTTFPRCSGPISFKDCGSDSEDLFSILKVCFYFRNGFVCLKNVVTPLILFLSQVPLQHTQATLQLTQRSIHPMELHSTPAHLTGCPTSHLTHTCKNYDNLFNSAK